MTRSSIPNFFFRQKISQDRRENERLHTRKAIDKHRPKRQNGSQDNNKKGLQVNNEGMSSQKFDPTNQTEALMDAQHS